MYFSTHTTPAVIGTGRSRPGQRTNERPGQRTNERTNERTSATKQPRRMAESTGRAGENTNARRLRPGQTVSVRLQALGSRAMKRVAHASDVALAHSREARGKARREVRRGEAKGEREGGMRRDRLRGGRQQRCNVTSGHCSNSGKNLSLRKPTHTPCA